MIPASSQSLNEMSSHRMTFSPIYIGSVKIPNRIVRTAHGTMFASGHINDELIEYHYERARSGVGLSIIEATAVHPSSVFALKNFNDAVIPPYRKLSARIEPTGMKLFVQLWHGGYHSVAEDGGPAWSVSSLPSPYTTEQPISMNRHQIQELVGAYASAAARVEEGGLHGVEVLSAQGYLGHQFLSPLLNQRQDEYGGSFDNRIRFLVEVLRAIRAATSSTFAVGVRLGASRDKRILDETDVNAVALRLQSEGLMDYVNITYGDNVFPIDRYAGMDQPAGYALPSSKIVGTGVTVPRLIGGRFGTLDDVEQALRQGEADLVSMVRAHIADPKLVQKTREGRGLEVRPCIACNQGCIGGIVGGRRRMGCTVNPVVGFESTLSEDLIVKTETPRRVLVVGGGPAGMEAARVALLYGHEVTLVEAGPQLGGMLSYAKRYPKLGSMGDIALWLENEVYRLGADIRLSSYFDASDVEAENPDAVIVATGSQPSYEGCVSQVADPACKVELGLNACILNSVELIDANKVTLGHRAIVLDDVGHYEAIACCEHLLNNGLNVIYITRHSTFAPIIEATHRHFSALLRLSSDNKFRIETKSLLLSFGDGAAVMKSLSTGQSEQVSADLLVPVTYREPMTALHEQLRGKVRSLQLVGDARSARDCQAAIREGHMAAREINSHFDHGHSSRIAKEFEEVTVK